MIKILVLKIFLKNVLVLVLKYFIILFGVALEQLLSDWTTITFGTANGFLINYLKTCCKNVLSHDVIKFNVRFSKILILSMTCKNST